MLANNPINHKNDPLYWAAVEFCVNDQATEYLKELDEEYRNEILTKAMEKLIEHEDYENCKILKHIKENL